MQEDQSLTVAEAAEQLGVSPRRIRQLLEAGRLTGRKSTAGWLIDLSSLRGRKSLEVRAGRALSPIAAWVAMSQLEACASGEPCPQVTGDGAAQIARRARTFLMALPRPDRDPAAWIRAFMPRATPLPLWTDRGAVRRLLESHYTATAGIHGLVRHGSSLALTPDDAPILYVSTEEAAALQETYWLVPVPANEATVELRVVDDVVAERLSSWPRAGLVVSALDVLPYTHPRERTASLAFLTAAYDAFTSAGPGSVSSTTGT